MAELLPTHCPPEGNTEVISGITDSMESTEQFLRKQFDDILIKLNPLFATEEIAPDIVELLRTLENGDSIDNIPAGWNSPDGDKTLSTMLNPNDVKMIIDNYPSNRSDVPMLLAMHDAYHQQKAERIANTQDQLGTCNN